MVFENVVKNIQAVAYNADSTLITTGPCKTLLLLLEKIMLRQLRVMISVNTNMKRNACWWRTFSFIVGVR